MTIHFDFTMSDIDAANLIDIISCEANNARLHAFKYNALKEPTRADVANRDWYNGHAEYLDNLKKIVLDGNKRVD